jgi:D-alanyl-D-alanine carboxypeptidase
MTKKRIFTISFIVAVLILVGIITAASHSGTHPKVLQINTAPAHIKTAAQSQQATFNKEQFSLTNPNSIWVVVNKHNPLQPKDYAPTDLVVPSIPLRTSASNGEMHLRKAAATALENMSADAKAQGVHFMLASGYRSYSLQVSVYGSEVKSYGQGKADTESARPGYSEHQTGLAMDLEDANRTCEVTDCFANLPEGKWLAANAYSYGFIIRYVPSKVAVTGYRYEPWHIRYIGTDLSTQMHKDNILTLEEFFSLPAASSYQ